MVWRQPAFWSEFMSPLVWTLWFGLLWAQGCLYYTPLYRHCLDILLGLRITAEQPCLPRSKSTQWWTVSLRAVCAGKLNKSMTILWPGMDPILCPNSFPSQTRVTLLTLPHGNSSWAGLCFKPCSSFPWGQGDRARLCHGASSQAE